jgi:hypothetical protein
VGFQRKCSRGESPLKKREAQKSLSLGCQDICYRFVPLVLHLAAAIMYRRKNGGALLAISPPERAGCLALIIICYLLYA